MKLNLQFVSWNREKGSHGVSERAALLLFFLSLCLLGFDSVLSQTFEVVGRQQMQGTVRSIQSGEITILTTEGSYLSAKIQTRDQRAIMIDGQPINSPAKIQVRGDDLSRELIEKGMVVEFQTLSSDQGKTEGALDRIRLANMDQTLQVEFLKRPLRDEKTPVRIVGRVTGISKSKLHVEVPTARWARQGRMSFPINQQTVFVVENDDLTPVRPGDQVVLADLLEIATGELIVRQIAIRLTAQRTEFTSSYNRRLEQQFQHVSNDPLPKPRTLNSNYFILHTDLSDRRAQILLAKLDTMYELIGHYFGKRPQVPIECYVVSELDRWELSQLHPHGLEAIRNQAGVTISQVNPATRQAQSVVYASSRDGICQHEAVHAFCILTFGSTGPVWYSEGMAELGQYWKPDQRAVEIDPVVIDYLTRQPNSESMLEIVNAPQITGDSWQAYAWRWALCHLLANNPNYDRRFKRLGITLMSGGNDSFESAFGSVSERIAFEYDQFVQNFGNGYRVDLCAWKWNVKASRLTGSNVSRATVAAAAGWQPTRLLTTEGESYDVIAEGEWQVAPFGDPIDADGDASGRGRLQGVVMVDYQLFGPFDLGTKTSFVSPASGQLFLRCRDDWTDLADNGGEVNVFIRRSLE